MKFKHAIVITGSIGSGKSTVCEMLRERGYEIVDADEISHRVLDGCAAQVAEIFGAEFVVKSCAQGEILGSRAEFDDEKRVNLSSRAKFKSAAASNGINGANSDNGGENFTDETGDATREDLKRDEDLKENLKFDASRCAESASGSRAFVNRKKLGELVFKNPAELAKLEALLHPKIKAEILSQARVLEAKGRLFFVDIPLFFEGKRYDFFDKVAVVYAPKDTLISRVMRRNGLDYDAAKSRVELQMDIEQKRALADFVVDNSGNLENLKERMREFLENLS